MEASSGGASAGGLDSTDAREVPRPVLADTAINSASTSQEQQGSPIADILENFQRMTPRDRFVVRPSVVKRLRGLGVNDPAAILAAVGGDDGLAGEEQPTFKVDELITECVDDPSKVFAPEAIAHLAALKQSDRAEFESLRQRLKGAGCRVTALDRAIAEERGETGRGPTQADVLIEIAEAAELFHAPDGTAYADVEVDDVRQTWAINSSGFSDHLTREYFKRTKGAPAPDAIRTARNLIGARARFDAPERHVATRLAGAGDRLYLDLCDAKWQQVEVTPNGWRIVQGSPDVRFRRAAGMRPLPEPVKGGSIASLRNFLNVTAQQFALVVAWLLAALRNRGPFPVLAVSGEQGTAKSTFAALLRSVVDPNTAPLRALPREDRDLFISANNAHVLVFDNVSGLPPWISDTLCRLATGGGFAVRTHYANDEETLFDSSRPIILTGVEDVVSRADLASRSLMIVLEAIPDEKRRDERDLWEEYEAERPKILGALLDAVAVGLRQLPTTTLDEKPRMADFALWATACEPASGEPGTFAKAYGFNRASAITTVIDGDPVAAAMRALMSKRPQWKGTAQALLDDIEKEVSETVRKAKTWPNGPRAISGRLRRAATFLRQVGISVEFVKGGAERLISISTDPEQRRKFASFASGDVDDDPLASSSRFASAFAPGKNPDGCWDKTQKTQKTQIPARADGPRNAHAVGRCAECGDDLPDGIDLTECRDCRLAREEVQP